MPNIMEISGADGMDLRGALALATIKKLRRMRRKKAGKKAKVHRMRAKKVRAGRRPRVALPGGMNAGRALELAERFFKEGRKPLAMAWARQAENRAKVEGNTAIARRAEEIIKEIRGAAVLQALAQYGDVKGLAAAQIMGIL